jgi:hypothetical protein
MSMTVTGLKSALALAAFMLVGAEAQAQAEQGVVAQISVVNQQLRFWLAECGYEHFYYVAGNDASREEARLIVMASRASGRPVSIPEACPSGDHVRVTQIDLVGY